MAFFQNVFAKEFIGNWVLGDRQASLSFRCPANTGRGDDIVQSYSGLGPFNLAGADANGNALSRFRIWVATDYGDTRGWTPITVQVAGAVPAATTAAEIVAALNADATFAYYFQAGLSSTGIYIRMICNPLRMFYVDNTMAETVLLFNARAGVSELPFYFDRHTIEKRNAFPDSANHLIALSHDITANTVANPTVCTSLAHGLVSGETITINNSNSNLPITDGNYVVTVIDANTFSVPFNVAVTAGTYATWARPVDVNIIANATDKLGNNLGFTLAGVQRDYELLRARAGIFKFTNVLTNDGTRPLRVLEYSAGAVPGDMAKLITYTWIAAAGPNGSWPASITEEPYVLLAGDILVP